MDRPGDRGMSRFSAVIDSCGLTNHTCERMSEGTRHYSAVFDIPLSEKQLETFYTCYVVISYGADVASSSIEVMES
jgi:hypothetical protein